MKVGLRGPSPRKMLAARGVANVVGHDLRPAAAELGRDLFGVVAETFEIAVFEGDDGAAGGRGSEGQLHLGQQIGIVGEPAVELPAEEQTRRRLPGDHFAPVRLDALGVALEPAAARARLDDDLHKRRLADRFSRRPPPAHLGRVRGLLGEHGVVVAKDIGNLRRVLARIVGDDENRVLNPLVRALMAELREELTELDARIAGYDRKIRELYRNSEICQRLGKVEGIGPVTATALVAAVGDRSSFKNGRQFAAWLGLVPKQRSSGGRARLFGISKRGDRYLRTLLIHGARSALGRVRDKQDPRSLWLGKMRQRRHPNIVAVALANKNARIAWSLLTSDSVYDAGLSVRPA